MSNQLIQQAIGIERQAADLLRLARDGHITEEHFVEIIDSVKESAKMLDTVAKQFENPIKKAIDLNSNYIIGNRVYTYKVTNSRVFDAEKAKDALVQADYHLDDFYMSQVRKSLIFEVKK